MLSPAIASSIDLRNISTPVTTESRVSRSPTISSLSPTFSFPRSSDPHPYTPGLCHLESRVDPSVPEALLRMGHKLRVWPAWTKAAGSLGAIQVDYQHGVLHGAADPRRMAYAIGR